VRPPGPSTGPILGLSSTPGVVYAVDSASSETAPVVRATLRDGYAWGPLPASWTQDDATTARFGLASPPPAPTTPGELARTGAAVLVAQSIGALSMLLGGLVLCRLARRRPLC
jgi:hypothetical protein